LPCRGPSRIVAGEFIPPLPGSLVAVECLPGSDGVRLPERHDYAKPEGRLRAAGHELVLPDGKWHGGDVTMIAKRYPVPDGAHVTAAVAHLNAIGHALDGEMAPRNVEWFGIRQVEVIDFRRLGFPRDGETPNAKWQSAETKGPGGCRRHGREPE